MPSPLIKPPKTKINNKPKQNTTRRNRTQPRLTAPGLSHWDVLFRDAASSRYKLTYSNPAPRKADNDAAMCALEYFTASEVMIAGVTHRCWLLAHPSAKTFSCPIHFLFYHFNKTWKPMMQKVRWKGCTLDIVLPNRCANVSLPPTEVPPPILAVRLDSRHMAQIIWKPVVWTAGAYGARPSASGGRKAAPRLWVQTFAIRYNYPIHQLELRKHDKPRCGEVFWGPTNRKRALKAMSAQSTHNATSLVHIDPDEARCTQWRDSQLSAFFYQADSVPGAKHILWGETNGYHSVRAGLAYSSCSCGKLVLCTTMLKSFPRPSFLDCTKGQRKAVKS